MKTKILFALYLFISTSLISQNLKNFTLKEIWGEYKFTSNYINGIVSLKDGKSYTSIDYENGIYKINKYDYRKGKLLNTLFSSEMDSSIKHISSYSFDNSEENMIINTNPIKIYRHSKMVKTFLYSLNKNKLKLISDSNIMYPSFSPDDKFISYVKNNNLYLYNILNGKTQQITNDGEKNKIINGASDWVYEEEFELTSAYAWSHSSKYLAYLKFNESEVKEYSMPVYNTQYPEYYKFKYPKAGEKNSSVKVFLYDINNNKTNEIKINDNYEYIPRIYWTSKNELVIMTFNRLQNHLKLLLYNTNNGNIKTIYEEKNEKYIELPTIYFLKNSNKFIISSEKSSYNNLYIYDIDKEENKNITKCNCDVTNFYGFDEKNEIIYYSSAEISPIERHIYKLYIKTGDKYNITPQKGWNDAHFSSSFKFFINFYSNANTPPLITVNNNNGKVIRILENNKELKETLKTYNTEKKQFFSFTTKNGVKLNAWMIKPYNFDSTKKYPVLMIVYGGPGAQTVRDIWEGNNFIWQQYLSQNGYIVVSVDNRGTGARGEKFKKITYKELGKYETEDQIEAAKYLASLNFVDKNRIGIMGWSYGGYMALMCLFKANNIFKLAVAVAPVTDWKFYDTIYTERYMSTPDKNKDAYLLSSPIYYVDSLKGKLLLIHGTADDNVHFQNSAELINALIKANKQFELMIYPNRNHGIYGDNARLHLFTKISNFIFENL